MRLEDVIRRPIVNEKSTLCRRYGNQYVFAVDLKATKNDIANAVSTFFGVKVESVNTLVMPGKTHRIGRHVGRTNKWKKAVVTLAGDQKIEFFDKVDESAQNAEA